MTYDEEIAALEETKKALLSKGVEVNIDACGCCNSPWIKVKIDGEVLLDVEGYELTMIKENEK